MQIFQVQAGNVMSEVTLAQHERQVRQRILKQSTAHRSEQYLPGDCERADEILHQNFQMRQHTDLPSLTPRRHPFNSLEQETTVPISAQKRQTVTQSVTSSSYMPKSFSAPHSFILLG